MRPLIEMLEHERTLFQRLESIDRHILKDDDPEVQDILFAKRVKFKRELECVGMEIRAYLDNIYE